MRPTGSSRRPVRRPIRCGWTSRRRPNQEAQATVLRAQEEIRVERDRVFYELRAQVGEIAVELAGRVVGESLDPERARRLIDDYIDEVTRGNGQN